MGKFSLSLSLSLFSLSGYPKFGLLYRVYSLRLSSGHSVQVLLFFSSWLCCLLRFQNSPQTPQWEGFLVFGIFSSFMTPCSGWVSIPDSLVSILVFYVLSYLLSKRIGCLSGWLVFSDGVQKLFCGSCSAFKWSFDELVGEKVVSLSYSSAILGLPPLFFFQCGNLIFFPNKFTYMSESDSGISTVFCLCFVYLCFGFTLSN